MLEMHPVRSVVGIPDRFERGHPGRISRLLKLSGLLPASIACKSSGVVLATLALLVGSVLTADAKVSITNRDTKDHKITIIIEGAANQDQVLQPAQVIEQVCDKGCVLRLNDSEDDEYQLEAEDVVSIEDGYLYYDNDPPAEAPVDPKADPSKSDPPKDGKKG